MGYTNFQNGITPINDTNLNAMQQGLMELVFPVGSTYTTPTNTNPNTILNFGTWERLKGKLCAGLDEDDEDEYFDEIGKTGGEKKHTITVNELPNHGHAIGYDVRKNATGFGNSYSLGSVSGGEIKENSIPTSNVGGGQAINIVQPYEVVGYMWIRRS